MIPTIFSIGSMVTSGTKVILMLVFFFILGVVIFSIWKFLVYPLYQQLKQLSKGTKTGTWIKKEEKQVRPNLENKQQAKKYLINHLRNVKDLKNYHPDNIEIACYVYFKKEVEIVEL